MREDAPRSFLPGPFSLWTGFIWGFAEATLFFVIPDVILTLVALFSIKQSLKVLVTILLGAILGGALMFWMGEAHPAEAEALVLHVPFISQKMVAKTHQDFDQYGIWALVKGPAAGVPYKIYAVQASGYARLPLFLLVTILARTERFVLSWAFFAILGTIFKRGIDRRPWAAVTAHLFIWTAIYAWYWVTVLKG